MRAKDALIAWTPARSSSPTAGMVEIRPLLSPGDNDWTRPYDMTGGAAYTARRKLEGAVAALMVFIDFNSLVVRDGIDPQVAHRAFLAIDQYRERISPDIPGAED